MKNRTVPIYRLRRIDVRLRGYRSIGRFGHQIMVDLPAFDNRQAAENDQVLNVPWFTAAGADGRGSFIFGVRRVSQQHIQGAERTPSPRFLLRVHLLEAENIGAEPLQLWPQRGDARRLERAGEHVRLAVAVDEQDRVDDLERHLVQHRGIPDRVAVEQDRRHGEASLR
jgi:hypothetical protein